MSLKIKEIEVFWVDVPFHEVPQRAMERNCHGWHILEMCRVETDAGFIGFGETLPNYTRGRVTKEAIERARGRNPFELMWDDSMGLCLQMALLDVAAKAAEVPLYRLLGDPVRQWCPISWWGIDMSPEDYASQTRDAVQQGYTSFKQKARPWWDVHEQLRLTTAEVDIDFKLDLDFNEHLNNAASAVPLLKDLEQFRQVEIYESPIPHTDLIGNRRVRDSTRCAIAAHYGAVDPAEAHRQGSLDGWVVGGGVTGVLQAARWCEQVNMPFWLQLVGTAWTTTLAAHLGAVCSHARWPAVTCMNMYLDQLVTEPIAVEGGYYRVPQEPGLGIEFNESSLQWQVDGPEKPPLNAYNQRALYAIVRRNGVRTWFDGEMTPQGLWPDARRGNQPVYEHGVHLETWYNDGSKDWQQLAQRVQEGPVRETGGAR